MKTNWITTVFGWLSGSGGGIIGKGLDIIAERTEDVDKRNEKIVELVRLQIEKDRNPVWVQALPHWQNLTPGARFAMTSLIIASALHYFSRIAIVGFALWLYVDMQKTLGQPIDIEQLLAFIAGPGLYVMMKGRGKS